MKVYFSHGKESGPWGSKIERLAAIAKHAGCSVESIDYTDISDPDVRVERLLTEIAAETEPLLLVGSSMGGYVSRSIRFAREADCSLHLIHGDHRLNASLDVIAGLFEGFLARVM